MEKDAHTYSFAIDFLDKIIMQDHSQIIDFIRLTQESYRRKGTLKTQSDKTWFGPDNIADEKVIPTESWRENLQEECAFFNIFYNPNMVRPENLFQDAYDFALSMAVKSIQGKYNITNVLMTNTRLAQLRFG